MYVAINIANQADFSSDTHRVPKPFSVALERRSKPAVNAEGEFASRASLRSIDHKLGANLSEPLFTKEERLAILIGHGDPLSRIQPGSRLGKCARFLFGIKPVNVLADPQLEALRRIALALRMGAKETAIAVEFATAAGICSDKIDFLLAL